MKEGVNFNQWDHGVSCKCQSDKNYEKRDDFDKWECQAKQNSRSFEKMKDLEMWEYQ